MSIYSNSQTDIIFKSNAHHLLGSASAVARVGAMITPYIAQVLVDHSLFSAIGVYAAMGMILSNSILISFKLKMYQHGQKII